MRLNNVKYDKKTNFGINVLVAGSGAREHAIAAAVTNSPILDKLFLFRPNAGFKKLGQELEADTFEKLGEQCVKEKTDLVVVGPETMLAEGIVDTMQKFGIKCIGPNKHWAQLESSKEFAKEFMIRYNIPTAAHEVVDNITHAEKKLDKFKPPYVIKADGLAAGKGVVITEDREEALATIKDFLGGKFNESSKKIVLEEFLPGKELSIMSLWDGKKLVSFVPARDCKRVSAAKNAPNTGGMGSIANVNLTEEESSELKKYEANLEKALKNENADFTGFVYSGLIVNDNKIKVIEYNMRLGDPETQPLLSHLKTDFLSLLKAAANKKLSEFPELNWKKGQTGTVVVTGNTYPYHDLEKEEIISPNFIAKLPKGMQIFFANVKDSEAGLKTSGGRVLSIVNSSEGNPFKDIYKFLNTNSAFKNSYYRDDLDKFFEF